MVMSSKEQAKDEPGNYINAMIKETIHRRKTKGGVVARRKDKLKAHGGRNSQGRY